MLGAVVNLNSAEYRVLRSVIAAVCVVFAGALSSAAAAPCHAPALEQLSRLAPEGYQVYRRAKDKSFFTNWISCDNVQLGLTTAVHETVHMITEEENAYPLIDGRRLPRVPERRPMFPPKLAAGGFDASSTYVETYMKPGAATSAEEFGYLLNELNAYTHDLHAAVQLRSLSLPGQSVHHRDGLAALMAFVAAYTEHARTRHPATWSELQRPELRRTVATLWAQSEEVMGNSCRTPDYGYEAPVFLDHFCRATIHHALGALLGRPPRCPVSCKEKHLATATKRRGS
jgi:hypothetical protein